MGYFSSRPADRLVREEGSEFANAFTLLGKCPWPQRDLRLNTLVTWLCRHIGDVLGCTHGSLAAQHIKTQGQTQDACRSRP